MVFVRKGVFVYGNEENRNLKVAQIAEDFWIDKLPVTNAQYLAFLQRKGLDTKWIGFTYSRIKSGADENLSIEAGFEDHPVTGVTWFGAEAFALDAGKRLPTEEEWERAARGIDGREYPWRGPFSKKLCNTEESKIRTTSIVDGYLEGASPSGALDMAGNVWEWTATPERDGTMVLRGGCWNVYSNRARCASRDWNYPDVSSDYIGFRCART